MWTSWHDIHRRSDPHSSKTRMVCPGCLFCVLLHNTWIINECFSPQQINPTAHFVQQQNSSLSTSWTAPFASFSLMFFHLSSRTFVKECAHVNLRDVCEIWKAVLWTRRSLCAECTVGACMRALRVGCVCAVAWRERHTELQEVVWHSGWREMKQDGRGSGGTTVGTPALTTGRDGSLTPFLNLFSSSPVLLFIYLFF